MMLRQLNKLNGVDAAELKAYIERIVGNMSKDQLAAMEKAPLGYAKKIKDKVQALLEQHCRENFSDWLSPNALYACRIIACQTQFIPLRIRTSMRNRCIRQRTAI